MQLNKPDLSIDLNKIGFICLTPVEGAKRYMIKIMYGDVVVAWNQDVILKKDGESTFIDLSTVELRNNPAKGDNLTLEVWAIDEEGGFGEINRIDISANLIDFEKNPKQNNKPKHKIRKSYKWIVIGMIVFAIIVIAALIYTNKKKHRSTYNASESPSQQFVTSRDHQSIPAVTSSNVTSPKSQNWMDVATSSQSSTPIVPVGTVNVKKNDSQIVVAIVTNVVNVFKTNTVTLTKPATTGLTATNTTSDSTQQESTVDTALAVSQNNPSEKVLNGDGTVIVENNNAGGIVIGKVEHLSLSYPISGNLVVGNIKETTSRTSVTTSTSKTGSSSSKNKSWTKCIFSIPEDFDTRVKNSVSTIEILPGRTIVFKQCPGWSFAVNFGKNGDEIVGCGLKYDGSNIPIPQCSGGSLREFKEVSFCSTSSETIVVEVMPYRY